MRCNSTKCLLLSSINHLSCHKTLLNSAHILLQNKPLIHTQQFGTRRFHSVEKNIHSWSVLNYIHQRSFKDEKRKFACLLLNISENSYQYLKKYRYIWDEAELRIAVDGSANCLAKNKIIHTANVVCGDFDSIDQELLQRLRCPTKVPKDQHNLGRYQVTNMPVVIETPSQNQTDFTKAINVSRNLRPDINQFFALYYSDGSRLDHLFGLVNTLHLVKKNIILVNIKSNTITWLLSPGHHTIKKPAGRGLCSLVPFKGQTEVNTQGLEYNIDSSSPLDFGSSISTSNICLEKHEVITVETNRELLWSIDVVIKR